MSDAIAPAVAALLTLESLRLMTRFLSLAAFALAIASCDSELLTVTDDFAGPSVTFDIDATDEAGTFAATADVDDVDLVARLDDNDIDEDNLRSVVMQSATATINDLAGEFDFDDVSAGSVTFSGGGLGAVVVAEIPAGATGTTTALTVRGDDIKAFLLLDDFTVSITGTSTAAIPENVTVTLATAYELTGGL